MAKKKGDAGFWPELLSYQIYKKNQGRLTRQLTAIGIGVVIFTGAWTLSQGWLSDYRQSPGIQVGIPLLIATLGAWSAFRLVNYPRFADFLISVEAEMDKVSWPGRQELIRATVVVVASMFLLGFVLFFYDFIWQQLFQFLGILEVPSP